MSARPANDVVLDMVRGLAAIAVVFGHARNLFLEDYWALSQPTILHKGIYFLSGFGHQAVMIFFVLSGFFISRSIRLAHQSGRLSWRNYALARLARLELVLIPGLLLTLALDLGGMTLFPSVAIYEGRAASNIVSTPASASLGVPTFIGNLLGLQTLLVPTFGTNGALWSLSNEFFYYAVYPFLFAAFAAGTSTKHRLVLAPIIVVLLASAPGHAFYFIVWLFGTGVDALTARPSWRPARRVAFAGWALFLGSLVASRLGTLPGVVMDLVIGFTFAMAVFGHPASREKPRAPAFARVAGTLSGFSYSLYVIHLPILVFASAAIVPGARLQPDASGLAVLGGLVMVCLALAWAFSLATEHRTEALRRWLVARTDPGIRGIRERRV